MLSSPSAPIPDLCARLDAWFAHHLPETAADLHPGLDPTALATAEVRLGRPLPADFKALYAWHDGQKGETTGPFHGLTFLSLADVLRHHQQWAELLREQPELGEPHRQYRSFPREAIRPVYVSPGWLPFAYDHGGNYLGIDLDPASEGTAGQVINFGRDEREHYVLGDSLGAYLAWLVEALEGGNFKIEDQDEGERSLNTSLPDSEHFLDGLAALFGPRGTR